MTWTETFQYDGFSNLTAKVLNGTTTPIAVNPATNRLTSAYYDANGNMTSGAGASFTYDEMNRNVTVAETSGGEEYYGYDASNKRIYVRDTSGNEWITFYGAKGEKLGKYQLCISNCGFNLALVPTTTSVWFGGRLISDAGSYSGAAIYQDRLGSNRASIGGPYYPYAEGAAGTDQITFATYLRDSYTGGGIIAGGSVIAGIASGGATTVAEVLALVGSAGGFVSGSSMIVIGLSTNGSADPSSVYNSLNQANMVMTPGGLLCGALSGGNPTAIRVCAGASAATSVTLSLNDLGNASNCLGLTASLYGVGSGLHDLYDVNDGLQPVVSTTPITIGIDDQATTVDPVVSPTTTALNFGSDGGGQAGSGTPTSDILGISPSELSSFESAGFAGCGAAYCPNQD